VTAKKTISNAIEDPITAEGFTQERTSVRASSLLRIELVSSGQQLEASQAEQPTAGRSSARDMNWANISFGNVSQPFNLPAQEEAERDVSRQMVRDADRSAMAQNNAILDGISNLLRYVERMLGVETAKASSATNQSHSEPPQQDSPQEFAPQGRKSWPARRIMSSPLPG
jgi:hypothetical protein